MRTCEIDDCDKKHYGKGLCKIHWQRMSRNGDPNVVKEPGKYIRVPKPVIKYSWAHKLVYAARGRASLHECVSCGTGAKQWAYNHDAVDELEEVSEKGYIFQYSRAVNDYQAMCVSCHVNFDKDRVLV